MQRIRQHAELEAAKVKLLRRELQIAHKRNTPENGEMGITWWSQEYWDEGKRVKKYTVKKEEPVTPIWWGQDYKPSTLMLTYHPSHLHLDINPWTQTILYGHLYIDHHQYKLFPPSFYSEKVWASGIC